MAFGRVFIGDKSSNDMERNSGGEGERPDSKEVMLVIAININVQRQGGNGDLSRLACVEFRCTGMGIGMAFWPSGGATGIDNLGTIAGYSRSRRVVWQWSMLYHR